MCWFCSRLHMHCTALLNRHRWSDVRYCLTWYGGLGRILVHDTVLLLVTVAWVGCWSMILILFYCLVL